MQQEGVRIGKHLGETVGRWVTDPLYAYLHGET